MASRPPDNDSTSNEARNRWMVIQAMRVFGFGIAVLGLVMVGGRVDIAGDQNQLLAYFFIAIGLLDGFVMPTVLARKWRTPPE